MNFAVLDWIVFLGLFLLLTSMSFFFRRFVKGVAHFLVAGRNVGRYLGLESDSMAGLGAITILGLWQVIYNSGFVGTLWYLLTPLAATVVSLTGFGIYRFRQTRAMTLGQFVEMRYSKKARIFFGATAYLGGVLYMGISPAAGANFFVYNCGFPPELWGIPTTEVLMIVLVGAAAIICFNGGQVTLVVTNFIQALFVNLMLIAIMIAVYKLFTWDQVAEAFLNAENADALLHPFSKKVTADFDKILIICMFSIIGLFALTFITAWIYNSAVDVPAEKWVGFWHGYVYTMFIAGVIFLVWVVTGGFRDLVRLFKNLLTQEVNVKDDGSVDGHHASGAK